MRPAGHKYVFIDNMRCQAFIMTDKILSTPRMSEVDVSYDVPSMLSISYSNIFLMCSAKHYVDT